MIGTGKTWVGVPAAKAWTRLLLADSAIRQATLLRYAPPVPLQQRASLGPKARQAVSEGRRLAARFGVPFWDAVLLTAMAKGRVPTELIDAASPLSPRDDDVVTMHRRAIAGGAIVRTVLAQDGGTTVCAIASRVSYAGNREAHFPMLDLRCKRSAANRATALDVASRLLPDGGWLLDSGRSYHVVGTRPVSAAVLGRFLANALLYAPIVDRHYVAHHLRRGWCSLRISRGGREDSTPTVVCTF